MLKLFNNKSELVDNIENHLKIKKENNQIDISKIEENTENEKIKVDSLDYYYSNVIARASKTMSDCRNNFIQIKKTGTNG